MRAAKARSGYMRCAIVQNAKKTERREVGERTVHTSTRALKHAPTHAHSHTHTRAAKPISVTKGRGVQDHKIRVPDPPPGPHREQEGENQLACSFTLFFSHLRGVEGE